ncbi:S8 family serine peptidase [Streptomyces chartreusis]|uniref:cyanobactin maturation protease PatG family protein n=1 Tax=Streptomyces chartreusis TaxID=1969 RepID=UPI003678FE1E
MEARSVLRGLEAPEQELLGSPEVCVAVLDGPVDLSHPCFEGADLTRIDTLVTEAPGPGPMSLHGTFVTSLIIGQPGQGVTGIVPRCRVLLLPVFRDGDKARVPQLDLARAIERAVEEGAHVINISGGERTPDGRPDRVLERALQVCEDYGVLVVAAVGNDGCDCLQVPAAVPCVLAVGASGPDGEPLDSNNWGETHSTNAVLAPGQDIFGAAPSGRIAALTGSSFATPLVSGVAALLIAAQQRLDGSADPLAVGRAILKSAAAVPCSPAEAPECRRYLAGHLDAARAFELVAEPHSTLPSPAEPILSGVRAASDLDPLDLKQPDSTKGAPSMASSESRPAGSNTPGTLPPAHGDDAGAATHPDRPEATAPSAEPQQSASGPEPTTSRTEMQRVVPDTPPPSAQLNTTPTPITDERDPQPGLRPACGGGGNPSNGCSCGENGNGNLPLVYALGTVGFDFRDEATRDGFRQLMPAHFVEGSDGVQRELPGDPYDPVQLSDYLTENPWASDKLTWTLLMDSTPIYALAAESPAGLDYGASPVLAEWDEDLDEAVRQPATLAKILRRIAAAPPVNRVYRLLQEAIGGQIMSVDDPNYVSRVSIPGVLTGRTVQLYSGEKVPELNVDARGVYAWNEAELVKDISARVSEDTADRNVSIASDTVQKTIRAMLDKFYYEFRNLGQSSPDRALNYAATNAFLAGQQIAEGLLSAKHVPGPEDRFYALDRVTVTKSPYCRIDSDCQLVSLVFFDPEDERRSNVTFQFTVDVSRTIPVILAPPRTFLGSSGY